MPELPAAPARHPFLIMNPRSGGGKVAKFDLPRKGGGARRRGVPDERSRSRSTWPRWRGRRSRRAADLLGVAGGDGTQALVAGVAAEHGIPFVVITAGTRNHFALDLGLDRDGPGGLPRRAVRRCRSASRPGHDRRSDVCQQRVVRRLRRGGADPAYRDDKLGTTLDTLPDLLDGQRGARLSAVADSVTIDAPQALLVANNPYGTGDIAGLGRRARLDRGVLGVVAVTVDSARQAVGLLRGRHTTGLRVLTARTVVVTAGSERIPVGIDGEAVSMPVPVRCAIRPGALRVRVPRDRPGVPPPKATISWSRLRRLASWRREPPPACAPAGHSAVIAGHQDRSGQEPDASLLRAVHRTSRRAWHGPGSCRCGR